MSDVSKEEALAYLWDRFIEANPGFRDVEREDVYASELYQDFISLESLQRTVDQLKGEMHAETALERSRQQPGESRVTYSLTTGRTYYGRD